jgi:hypothetical protein
MPEELREPSDSEVAAKMKAQHRLAMRQRAADRALEQIVREAEERGELAHLYGKQLEIEDDPNWFVARTLKEAGYSHPLLEQRRDLDAAAAAAEEIVSRLRERREWLIRSGGDRRLELVRDFNERRQRQLDAYREKLAELKCASLDFNLSAPATLHCRYIDPEERVQAAAGAVPPLDLEVARPAATVSASWLDRLRARLNPPQRDRE